MLRPERMSRVSVTGSRAYMEPVVDAVHDLQLMDMTDYDGGWEGFTPGNPVEGADEASGMLVTVRALKSTLGVTEADANEQAVVMEDPLGESFAAELEEVRERVNELDDRRDELDDELRDIDDRLDALDPFERLGIDLDLLSGYDNLSVAVGEGDPEAARRALAEADGVHASEVFAEDGAIAAFAYPAEADVADALVGANFTAVDVPDAEGDPEAYAASLRQERETVASKLETVESELDDLRAEVGGFLLAAEETLSIETQKREAPLSFATTENAFVAEGWIPTERFVDLAESLQDAAGDHVEVEELERADYDEHGFATAGEGIAPGAGGAGAGEPVAADGGEGGSPGSRRAAPDGGEDGSSEPRRTRSDGGTPDRETGEITEREVRSDGGHAHGHATAGDRPMSGAEPPTVQDNPDPVKPFEALTEVINRPKYWELDPTVIIFLTFPAFFGFMIGDVGYGIGYTIVGYLLWTRMDSDVMRSLGGVAMWAGGFTILFGILYGEIFGMHTISTVVWEGALGMKSSPLHKGLQPVHSDFALGWLVLSLVAGVVHLTIGWIFDFYENLSHGFADAMYESGSWLLMLFGIWVWIMAGAGGSAPSILVGPDSVFNGHPIPLGFTGFPEAVGLVGLVAFVTGLVLLVYGEPIEGVEFLNVLVNVLSYTRLAAVLLAKAGMAFVVNLLFFGVYVTETDHGAAWHFATGHMPEVGATAHGHEVTGVLFGGLIHGGIGALVLGIVVLVFGHVLVFLLGITSAGLQAIRLEYVEFFQKFYEGGGRAYSPFGYERRFTAED
ncbi:MAG: V-type ATP synthase subunit I [Haloarculaceae archaeon]